MKNEFGFEIPEAEKLIPPIIEIKKVEIKKPLYKAGDEIEAGKIILVTDYLNDFVYSVEDKEGRISKIAEKTLS